MHSGLIKNQPVSSKKKNLAREFRQNMTEAEKIFWSYVRNRKFRNLKFRRQQIVEGFIIDFYCDELHLCVEIDGPVHSTEAAGKYDPERDKAIKLHDLTIMRFSNDEVINNIEGVLKKIGSFKPIPPSPLGEGG